MRDENKYAHWFAIFFTLLGIYQLISSIPFVIRNLPYLIAIFGCAIAFVLYLFYFAHKPQYPLIISVIILLGALESWPSYYYTALRVTSTIALGYIAFKEYSKHEWNPWSIAASISALLMNPIIPVYLKRSTWQTIDLILAAFILAFLFIRKETYIDATTVIPSTSKTLLHSNTPLSRQQTDKQYPLATAIPEKEKEIPITNNGKPKETKEELL